MLKKLRTLIQKAKKERTKASIKRIKTHIINSNLETLTIPQKIELIVYLDILKGLMEDLKPRIAA